MAHRQTIFEPFLKLPTEARLMIWKLLIRPRVLEITSKRHNRTIKGGPVPVALHINQESRVEALKSYKLIFDDMPDKSPFWAHIRVQVPKQIYVNFAIDTFYIGYQSWLINSTSRYSGPEGPGGDYASELQHFGCHYASAANVDDTQDQPNVPCLDLRTERFLEPGQWEFIEQNIWPNRKKLTGRYHRQYCTEKQRDARLGFVQDLLGKVKEKHPEWKRPVVEGRSLVKIPARHWLG